MTTPSRTPAVVFLYLSFFSAAVALAAAPSASTAAEAALPAIAAKTVGLERRPGLLTVYVDRQRGKVWLEVPPAHGPAGEVASFLYVEGIVTGLGATPVGLDRGQIGDTHVLDLRRVGGRVLLEEPNLRFRALSREEDERRTVRESFATSVLWGGEVAALDPDGRALVDFTPFILRDSHGIVTALKTDGQGSWSLDAGRSALDLENTLSFPENLEFEALLTYQSAEPGALVTRTTPVPGAMTLLAHQSLLKLPDDGYRPRAFDPRTGFFPIEFQDFAAPLTAPLGTAWISRHRLEKIDPAAPRSAVRKPLVYYVDSGAPEPVRSALVEGASWWKEAFEGAGFIDAFKVEVLPPGVNPMDARYNVIQWVHRATRGWSYGGGVADPRTGEIVKGYVTLGSQRIRQDVLLFEGLLGADKTGSGGPDDPVQVALARIRQLAAHEVGHSLGLEHNFAASTYGRASVMDYPAPLVGITRAGDIDLSNAYAVGMGAWDLQAIRWGYGQLPPGTTPAGEAAALDAIARDGLARGLVFLTDQDARPPGAAEPRANLWDNGPDPVAGLEQALAVRQLALARFGEKNIGRGRPLALLQEVLAPVYFHHRYQLDAAVKVVGGLEYTYALRGDGQPPARPVAGDRQRRALKTLAGILQPAALDLPEPLLALLLPRPAGYRENVEMFGGAADPAFDALGAAATAADQVVAALLQPERAARVVDFHRRDASLPGLEEVLEALVRTTFGGGSEIGNGRQAELRRVAQWVVVNGMLRLARDPAATPGVRARVDGELARLRQRLQSGQGQGEEAAQRRFLAAEIARHLDRREADAGKPAEPLPPPPGMPIGATLGSCSWGE